ncbi:MAG: ATP-binding cassette domain-containing protein [Calditrichaeota bacterium]|nr:ATP-binding cassette domain-containing protein [Calditrichota bacterium]
MNAIELDNVWKSFGETTAVAGLDLVVPRGCIFGLLGPNGAGKTTTIRMVMDIIAPDRGEIRVLGQPNSGAILDRVGYLPEERGLYPKMKVIELLELFGVLKGLARQEARARAADWLDRFGLQDWGDKKVEQLSRGMQQKVMFIGTILHRPDVIILDEPFSGLDPISSTEVKEIILEQKERGATVVFSTHLMEQVEKLCDEICLINEGKAVLQGRLAEVKSRFGARNVLLAYDGQPDFLYDTSLVAHYDDYGHYVEIQPAEGVSPQAILERAVREVEVWRFEVKEPSLHDIFIQVVKGEAAREVPA